MEKFTTRTIQEQQHTLCINGRMLRHILEPIYYFTKGTSNCTVNFQDLLNDCFHETKAIDMK
jgi:hypothetical protein